VRKEPSPAEVFVRVFMSVIFLSAQTALFAAEPATAEAEDPPENGAAEHIDEPGQVTLGGMTGEGQTEGTLDVLIPVHQDESGLVFFNPRATADNDNEEEVNVGLGYRRLFPEEQVIVGVNAYYDMRWTDQDNIFHQLGVGAEYLSKSIDARANCYFSLSDKELIDRYQTTTVLGVETFASGRGAPYATGHEIRQGYSRTVVTTTLREMFDVFETPLEGYDVEIGGWVPMPEKCDIELGLFAGYYSFGEGFGDNDISGLKGRMELRMLPAFMVDAQVFENDELNRTDYFVGARLQVPLRMGELASGEAFKAGRRPFVARTVENVMRDPHIRKETRTEKTDERLEQSTESSGTETVVLLPDVEFVHNGNHTGTEDGTAENPRSTIQEGVDNAFGQSNVYVYAGSGDYAENVRLQDGVTLIGQGCPIVGPDGSVFGGDAHPTVDGRSLGPSIKVANNTTVRGMRVINTELGGAPQPITVDGVGVDVRRVGIFGLDANNVTISCRNIVEQNEYGVFLGATGVLDVAFAAEGSTFRNNDDDGVLVVASGNSGTFSFISASNDYLNNGDDGLEVHAQDFDTTIVGMTGDSACGNREDGVDFDECDGNSRLEIALAGLVATNNGLRGDGDHGVDMEALTVGAGGFLLTVQELNVSGNDLDGLNLNVQSGGSATALFANVTGNSNLGAGFNLDMTVQDADAAAYLGVSGLTASLNGDDGVRWSGVTANGAGGRAMIVVDGATANDNGNDGMDGFRAQGEIATVTASGITASGNSDKGAYFAALAAEEATVTVQNSVTHDNRANAGLIAHANSASGTARVAIGNAAADGNADCGIHASADSGVHTDVTVADSSAHSNDASGIWVRMNSGGTATGLFDPLTGSGNAHDTLGMKIDAIDNIDITVLDVTAAEDANAGVYCDLTSVAGSITTRFENVVSHDSVSGAGIGATICATNGDVAVFARNITVNDNGNCGFNTTVRAGRDIFAGIADVAASGNGAAGIRADLETSGGSIIGVYDPIVANSNAHNGLSIAARAPGDVDLSFLDITANGSQGDNGIWANVTSSDRGAAVRFNRISASDNANRGIDAFVTGNGGSTTSVFANITANENAGSGISLHADAYGAGSDLWVAFSNIVANGNQDYGVRPDTESHAGSAMLIFDGIEANSNAQAGVDGSATAPAGDSVIVLQNASATGNGDGGLRIAADAYGSNALSYALVSNCFAAADQSSEAISISADSLGVGGRSEMSLYGVTSISNTGVSAWLRQNALHSTILSISDSAFSYSQTDGGLYIDPMCTGTVSVVLSGVRTIGNAGGEGVDLDAVAGGNISVAFTNVVGRDQQNNRNLHVGLVSATGQVDVVLSGVEASGSANDQGLNLEVTTAGDTGLLLDGIVASNNAGGNGIDMWVTVTGTATMVARDLALYGNQRDGLDVTLDAGGAVSLLVSNATANMNSEGGFELRAFAGGASRVEFVDVTASGNSEAFASGIDFDIRSGNGLASALFRNVDVSSNRSSGIVGNIRSEQDSVDLRFVDIRAVGNVEDGITMWDMVGAGNVNVDVDRVTAIGNAFPGGGGGIYLDNIESTGGDVAVFGSHNVLRTNNSFGIMFSGGSAAGTMSVDFGGGTLGSAGQNSFTDNGGVGLWNGGVPVTIEAQSNFWGNVPPIQGTDYSAGVNATNWLTLDPNP